MKWLKWLVRTAVAAVLLAAVAAGWLLSTESGLRWALGFAPAGLTIEGARGALIRIISADRIAWQGSEARNVSLELNLLSLLADTISIGFLHMDSLSLRRPEGGGTDLGLRAGEEAKRRQALGEPIGIEVETQHRLQRGEPGLVEA